MSSTTEDCEQELDFIKKIIGAVGPRLPGSQEERAGAQLIAKELSEITGSAAITEEFTFAPKASIGFIPVLGFLLIFMATPLYLIGPLIDMFLISFFLFFTLIQIIRYWAWFDVFFPKSTSQNVYSIVEPRSGTARYTILVAGHIDSSWNCKNFVNHSRLARPKLIFGVVCAVILDLLSLVRFIMNPVIFTTSLDLLDLAVVPLIPGFFFVSQYCEYSKKRASPGAMDNLTGMAMTRWLALYCKDNPDLVPDDCKLVFGGFGSEEAGLKGSHAFVKQHKDDLLAGNCWVILMDSLCDYDHFHVVKGDAWLGSNYDPDLVKLADDAMTSTGIKHDVFKTPEGSTDGASFSRAGIRVVCLAAQDPGPADNYHTFKDVPERLDKRTLIAIKKILLKLIDNVVQFNTTAT